MFINFLMGFLQQNYADLFKSNLSVQRKKSVTQHNLQINLRLFCGSLIKLVKSENVNTQML